MAVRLNVKCAKVIWLRMARYLYCDFLDLTRSETRKVSFRFGAHFVGILVAFRFPRHTAAVIICDVDVCGAFVTRSGTKTFVIDRTLRWQIGFFFFASGCYRASELFPVALPIGRDAGKFHLKSGFAERKAVGAQRFIGLFVAFIKRDERF